MGLAVVDGTCPTFGFAGGYTRESGHFEPASRYGMVADLTLVMEVIRGSGDSVTVSPTQNTDLHWAFGGGGGGTESILFSLTSKIRQDFPLRWEFVF